MPVLRHPMIFSPLVVDWAGNITSAVAYAALITGEILDVNGGFMMD